MVAHRTKVCYNLLKDCPLRPFAGLLAAVWKEPE